MVIPVADGKIMFRMSGRMASIRGIVFILMDQRPHIAHGLYTRDKNGGKYDANKHIKF